MTALEIALAGYLAFGQPTGNYYEATYSIKEINCGERLHLEGGSQSSLAVSGRDLMERGLAVMLSGDYDSAVFEICRQEAAAGLAAGCCADGRPGYDTLEAFRRGAQTVTTNCAKRQLDEYRNAAK